MKKSFTASTIESARSNSIDIQQHPKGGDEVLQSAENPISPIKWGFLAAGFCHLANTGVSGFTSKAPWACYHGTLNIIIAAALFYVVWRWNGRCNTNLYVRQELLRVSVALVTLLAGSTVGHIVAVMEYANGTENADCVDTSLGCIKEPWKWTPIFYVVICVLWAVFVYVQYVANTNLQMSSAPQTVTINEEVAAHSVNCADRKADRPRKTSALAAPWVYYALTTIAVVGLSIIGFVTMRGRILLSLIAFASTSLILSGQVSLATRASVYALYTHGALIAAAIVLFATSFINAGSMSTGSKATVSAFVVAFQVVAFGAAFFRYQHKAEVDTKAQGEVKLFGRKKQVDANVDPLDFFMAGVSRV